MDMYESKYKHKYNAGTHTTIYLPGIRHIWLWTICSLFYISRRSSEDCVSVQDAFHAILGANPDIHDIVHVLPHCTSYTSDTPNALALACALSNSIAGPTSRICTSGIAALHQAHEAGTRDTPSPLKIVIRLHLSVLPAGRRVVVVLAPVFAAPGLCAMLHDIVAG